LTSSRICVRTARSLRLSAPWPWACWSFSMHRRAPPRSPRLWLHSHPSRLHSGHAKGPKLTHGVTWPTSRLRTDDTRRHDQRSRCRREAHARHLNKAPWAGFTARSLRLSAAWLWPWACWRVSQHSKQKFSYDDEQE
jgi:hypothetical protein